MSGVPRWRFARMPPSQVNQDPFQGEFFTSSSDLPKRLVREAIQNSLDARLGDGDPVRVRFVFSGKEHALDPERAARYLDGLKPHLGALPDRAHGDGRSPTDSQEAAAIGKALALLDQPMTYLAIEDFGTTGLSGDIGDNPERAEGNDFWGFFRSVGISTKSEDAGGSWGLGKWVFPDASIINAYFGLTQRPFEDRVLLMGMALLKTHSIGNDKYPPYGYFAAASDDDDDAWLPMPVDSDDDNDFVDTLLELDLDRLDEPGLSILIPFPKAELSHDSIARAVLTQYFLPIVRNHLIVEICRPTGSGAMTRTVIASDTIREFALRSRVPSAGSEERDDESPRSLSRAISLAEWAIGRSRRDHLRLPAPISKDSLPSDLSVEDLRERYERGERLAFLCEFPPGVQRRGTKSRSRAAFSVYLERADDLDEGHDYFVRGHLRIPDMDHLRSQKSRALIYVDSHSELAHLLRDSEGPAHARWDPHAQRLKERWTGGFQRVQGIRRAAVLLLKILSERGADPQVDALADLFPGDGDPRSRRGLGSGAGPVPPDPRPIPPVPPSPLLVVRVPNGFSILPSRRPLVPSGTAFSVHFAYDVARGNAFRAYESGSTAGFPDFSLDDGTLTVEHRGCDISRRAPNELLLTIRETDFECAVTGFDGRDVIVKLGRRPAATASAGADR